MAEILSLHDAVKQFVNDGDTVALEGFTHLIPTAAGHEIIRQGKKDLTLVRMTPDLIYDQLIGAGCARKLIFSWGGNPGVGSLHRLRDAVEKQWPHALEIEEHSHADLANAYVAGASGLPFAVLRAYAGSDLPKVNPLIKSVTCPFTGSDWQPCLGASGHHGDSRAKADRKGDVLLWGILGVQKEAALAAKRCIVTVEEIVDDLKAPMNACVLPTWALSAVCHVPGGAHPSYAHGYTERDNRFYQAWDPIARDRETFTAWINEYIHGSADFSEFQAKLAAASEAK
jgi:glutaconate CoA-transferase subunit A